MEKAYTPQNEENIYKLWEDSGSFTPRRNKKKKPFCIIMPPPNANAPLHVGHAMFITLEDLMIRFRRMQGFSCLWLPGHDHAGILTQVVFERTLEKKGKTRFDLGRESFYRACWEFTEKNKKKMFAQIRRLGASCDWRREKFTLDPKISQEVLKTFISLYEDGLVYRDNRLINWCPRCMTALSNLEVEYKEEKSQLWFIKYPLKFDSEVSEEKRFLVVATTRPETMLGDTGVAVHPDDSRYCQLVGKKVILPIQEREIPVIGDREVDPEFGSGAVKVTPAHDPVDFNLGQRHKLEIIRVIGFDNKMTKKAGQDFIGLSPLMARKKVLGLLEKKDYLLKVRSYKHRVAYCERCQTLIEPQVSKQFFIKTSPLAKKAVTLVKKGKIKILPKKFAKNYLQWMNNIYDWCISRQLWWGQQLPVWYCGVEGFSSLQKTMNQDTLNEFKEKKGCGNMIVSLKKPKKCPKCKGKNFVQDPDVFDTWFSSGQWPYTALGYKRLSSKFKVQSAKLRDFNYWYPTTVMETGYEILFFWVARMIMLGLYRTGKIPFKMVYLHGLVLDETGEKMSKSRPEFSLDPLEVCQNHGADSLRMALLVGTAAGNDITLTQEKIKGYRNFCNKIWNAGRFTLFGREHKLTKTSLNQADKKILKELKRITKRVTKFLENYQFSQAGETLYQFFWHDFCDQYLETTKGRREEAQETLEKVLKTSLILLHPFMPFVTEAVWQKVKNKKEDNLIETAWPKV